MNREQKDKFYAALMRGLIGFLRWIPLDISGHLFDFAGRCGYLLLAKKRREAYWSMRLALPHLTEKQRQGELRAQFRHLARNLAEVLTFEKLTKEEIFRIVKIEGWERIENAVAAGRGVVFLTAHYGNWELMQIYSGLRGRPIHVLGRDQKFPKLNEILMRQREVHGSVAISRGMNVRFLLKALKDASLVGILGDESAGRDGGVLLPFFGKVTSVPTGAFELARRTNAVVLPCFMIRKKNREHDLFVEEALPEEGESDSEVVENQAKAYLKRLESYIECSPRQWLWQNKRWKYSWTRSVVVLSDGKPGHFKQSQAVADLMTRLDEYHGRKGLTVKTKTIAVKYHSAAHARVLFGFGWLLRPFIRGRMNWLKYFITDESLQALRSTHADFIVTAGSSMAPMQHLFAAETGAKKIVLMKPSFPYLFFGYDLAVVPSHDQPSPVKNTFQTLISPSGYNMESLEPYAEEFSAELRGSGRPDVALFIGGKTRNFDISLDQTEKILSCLGRVTASSGGYIVTTSRRTSVQVERVVRAKPETPELCRRRIVASEDPRSLVAKAMLGLAKRIIVTEDSLAMISEAVATGKPVIVLRLSSEKLPLKHRKFLEKLQKEKWVVGTDLKDLEEVLRHSVAAQASEFIAREKEALKEALGKLL